MRLGVKLLRTVFVRAPIRHSILRPLGLSVAQTRLPSLSTALSPRRTLFQIPMLGMAGKVLALITLKKLAIVAIINKLGVARTFQIFRDINKGLFSAQSVTGGMYTKQMYDGIDTSITVLENSLKTLAPQEHAQKVYNWFKDQTNQPFVQGVLKTYLEMFPSVKWMKTAMGFDVSAEKGSLAAKEAQELSKRASADAAAIATLEAEIQKAVSAEDWNACVKLRDDIHAIQKRALEAQAAQAKL